MWKDLDILSQNIENLTQNTGPTLPFQFQTPPTKPATIIPYIKNIEYSVNTSNSLKAKFLINSTGFLDPYFTFLELSIQNSNAHSIYVEKNYFQLVEKLIITTNGNVIEEIDKVDYIMDLLVDLNLAPDDFDRFSHFGFYSTVPPLIKGTTAHVVNDVKPLSKQVYKGKPYLMSPDSTRKILIPLPSRYFGCGQDFNAYKFIPLERFPNLEIELHFSKSSFLNPNFDIGVRIPSNRNVLESNIELRIQKLITRQLYFDSSALEYVKKYYKGDLILENTMYCTSTITEMSASLSEKNDMIMHHRQSLKKIYYLFYNKQRRDDLDTLQPKYFRVSPHITEMQAKCADEYYPENPIRGISSSTTGEENNSQFLTYFNNSHYITISNQMKNSINAVNYSLTTYEKPDYMDVAAITDADVVRIQNTFFPTPHCVGKSIFCFDFESIPFTGMTFRNGIDTRFNRPVFCRFKFSTNDLTELLANNGNARQLTIVPILEYDSILKVAENGYITKEF